jgi:CRISPR type III-associated protein (TIGR04423 family)
MIERINISKLKSILSNKFEGYYWLSNADAPEDFSDPEQLLSALQQSVPFVIEAKLFSEKDQQSISIKNVDGEAIVTQIDLKQIKGDAYHVQDLAFKSIKGFRDIKVRQVWRSAPDELVEGMDVMRPLITVFAGFKNA